LGISFLGYREPIGFYGFLDFLTPFNGETLRAYTAIIGAIFLMVSFIGYQPLRRLFDRPFSRYLGIMSFPIYLVHLILIFSLGSKIFVLAQDDNNYGMSLVITALTLIPAIMVLAGIFAVIDIRWIAFVNRAFQRIRLSSR